MQSTIETLEKRIDELENRSRRGNLIVYGLPEANDETSESLEKIVNEKIIRDTLELDPIEIERIDRLGRPAPDKTRPVIFKLLDTRQKAVILKQCKKLKDTEYSIREDFSRRIRDIRKKLWDSAKENRDKKDKVSLAFDKLYINNCAFVWRDEKGERVPLDKKKKRRHTNPTNSWQRCADQKITLLQLNARSILNKIQSLETTLLLYEPDMWLLLKLGCRHLCTIMKYVVVRKDRPSRGGGRGAADTTLYIVHPSSASAKR